MGIAIVVAGLMPVHAPVLAQSVPSATTNTPAADAIGPPQLQNFNLQGTVTRPAEPARPGARAAGTPAATTAPSGPQPTRGAGTQPAPSASAPAPRRPAQADEARDATARTVSAAPARAVQPRATAPQGSSVTVNLPAVGGAPAADSGQAEFATDADSAGTLAPSRGLPLWPWLLAAIALGAGGAFLLWRRQHGRQAFAGGPPVDAYVAPEPATSPRAAPPTPAPPASPAQSGVVSTRLRPWLDIAFEPLRCIVEDDRVSIEFDIGLYNSGSTPAREVLIEASIFNASPAQDRELDGFFARPVGKGERIPTIPPLKGATLRPRVPFARDNIRVLQAGGRQVFVPLIAFNVIYRWGNGVGQTSAAYLIGRDTKAEKLAPFRLDLGARVFRGLGSRALPIAVRS